MGIKDDKDMAAAFSKGSSLEVAPDMCSGCGRWALPSCPIPVRVNETTAMQSLTSDVILTNLARDVFVVLSCPVCDTRFSFFTPDAADKVGLLCERGRG